METLLAVGEKAPNFRLQSAIEPTDEFIELSDYLGKKNVILSFYPADWSDVCSSQMTLYNELLPAFDAYNAVIFGISVDGVFCHNAFRKNNNMTISLLADFEPKGAVAELYGAYDESVGMAGRALFVIDTDGVIQYSYLSPAEINPGAKEIFDTLENIHHGPANIDLASLKI